MSNLASPPAPCVARPLYSVDDGAAGRHAEPAVELSHLTKRYARRRSLADVVRARGRRDRITVVDRVSFSVQPGEIFGLLGPNGAGKTTIFKMLSTMIVPDEGAASIAGHDVVAEGSAVRRLLAAVPADERSLNWRLSARENLALYAALYRIPRAQSDARIDDLIAVVGLTDAGGKLVGAFSSGMRQRLLIARALLGRPRILLLDEPTRSLDPISAQEFRAFLRRELIQRERCTIILATHNTDEAFAFCDRVAVLHLGRVLATGAAGGLAARFCEERYRLLTPDPTHPAFDRLEQTQLLRRLSTPTESGDGWSTLECVIGGGAAATGRVLRELVESDVTIARFERVELSLADLITRIIAAEPGGATHA